MARAIKPVARSFRIESTEGGDPAAARLWHDLHGPSCTGTKPHHWLVAREVGTGRMLGVAQYFRTFPPEDACGAVLVVPEALHGGACAQLLQELASKAIKDGIRNLGTLVSRNDHATMELLREARAPIRVSPLNDGLYVEIDLLTFSASGQPIPTGSRPTAERTNSAYRYH